MRNFLCDANGSNNAINLKKGQNRGIENFLNCAPMFLFFISMKLEAFCVAQNETPQMAKMSVSTNKLSHFFAEHAWKNSTSLLAEEVTS